MFIKGVKMKLSQQTLNVIKNFATINPSIVLKPGTEIKTISPQKTIIAIASIPDEIPSEACVYDASRFLSVLSLFKDPEIRFNEKYCTISEEKMNMKYVFADKSMVITPPETGVKFPSEDVSVDVKWNDLQSVIKAAGVLGLPEIAFVGDGEKCYLKAIKSSDVSADDYGIELGNTSDIFRMIVKAENLKLMPFDYKVTLSSKGISKFESNHVNYFIAVETTSSYKKGDK
jgi:hypothetical protein